MIGRSTGMIPSSPQNWWAWLELYLDQSKTYKNMNLYQHCKWRGGHLQPQQGEERGFRQIRTLAKMTTPVNPHPTILKLIDAYRYRCHCHNSDEVILDFIWVVVHPYLGLKPPTSYESISNHFSAYSLHISNPTLWRSGKKVLKSDHSDHGVVEI